MLSASGFHVDRAAFPGSVTTERDCASHRRRRDSVFDCAEDGVPTARWRIRQTHADTVEPLIVPLAIPALAGPSALVTVLLFSSQARMSLWLYALVILLVAVVWLAVLLAAERLQRVLGDAVMTAFERLMGLILTAIAIEMLLAGVRAYVASL